MSDELWPGGVPDAEDGPGDTGPADDGHDVTAAPAGKLAAQAAAAPPAAAVREAAVDPLADYQPSGDPLPTPPVTASPTPPAAQEVPVLPVEAAAEASILAALLCTPDTYNDIADLLVPEDFGDPRNEAVFRAIVNCDATGRPFDPINVADELTRTGELNRIGGLDALRRLAGNGSTTEPVGSHVQIVLDRALRRRLAGAARTIGSTALSPRTDAAAALAEAEAAVFALGEQRTRSSAVEMPKVVTEVLEQMAKARSSTLIGHSTGFAQLDKFTGGWQPGQLIIVAGRPGMGKSVLALQWARLISELSDTVVPFFSFEMNRRELGTRLLSSATGIDLSLLLRGHIPDGMDRVIATEAAKLSATRLLIDDVPPRTIGAMRSYCRRLARRAPLGAVVVDYAQLMEGEGRRKDENRAQEISDISRGLKALADELGVPVIACSQLNRGLESRPNRRPLLSDLRESGSLEQDATVVIAAYRDWMYDKSASDTDAELLVLKNRNGINGVAVAADFEGRCVRFKDTDRRLDSDGGPAPAPAGGPAGGAPAARGGGFGGGARAGSWSSQDPF